MRYICCLLLFLLLGCNSSESSSLESSGDPAFDQSAAFTLHLINKLRKRPGMDSASKIIDFMTSTIGSAELIPPNPELEPDMAAHYKGPRPAKGVPYGVKARPPGFVEKEILLEADNTKNVIIAKAYSHVKGQSVFTWRWQL